MVESVVVVVCPGRDWAHRLSPMTEVAQAPAVYCAIGHCLHLSAGLIYYTGYFIWECTVPLPPDSHQPDLLAPPVPWISASWRRGDTSRDILISSSSNVRSWVPPSHQPTLFNISLGLFIFSSKSDIVVDKTGRTAAHEAGAGRVVVAGGGDGDEVAGALLHIERTALHFWIIRKSDSWQ